MYTQMKKAHLFADHTFLPILAQRIGFAQNNKTLVPIPWPPHPQSATPLIPTPGRGIEPRRGRPAGGPEPHHLILPWSRPPRHGAHAALWRESTSRLDGAAAARRQTPRRGQTLAGAPVWEPLAKNKPLSNPRIGI